MIKKIVKKIIFSTGKFKSIYLRFFNLNNTEYIEYLKKFGGFYSIGNQCHINRDTKILNPAYTRIGNNVCLSSCTLIGHDASVSVLNRAYNIKLDSVGKIDIRDHVFIGMGAIIMPNVVIGEKSVVAAGAVVTKDVPAGSIVAGVPAKIISSTDDFVKKLQARTDELPWREIIYSREGAYDASLEPTLIKERVKFFFEGK